ncbi:MAG: efflux RND transporter periplasmic adaptor subunit [Saprospiraceae bacterium]|nr:efflux RND transporter periplasmic adaptor subunit [Saprospiraceae bacterium]
MSTKKKSRIYLILGAVLIILVALAIYKSKTREKGEEVEISKVEIRTIKELVSASGKIFPEKEVVISSDVSGEVVDLAVEEGDSVQAGQMLAHIDPEAYESAVERGIAAVNSSKSQLSISKANLENSKAQREQIKAQYENAKRIHDRNKQLLSDGVISTQEYEASMADLESAEANLRAAEANIRSSEENIKANEFAIKSSEASLKELRTSLKKTTIFAPVDGIISKLDIEEGERVVGTIQMAGTEMMRIANMSVMEVQVDVSENDILKVSLGDSTEIEVDAYLDRNFKGIVTEIANSASSVGTTSLTTDQVTNFVVKIRMDPSSYEDLVTPRNPFPFRPGMSASVEINTNTEEKVTAVPILAVTTRDLNAEKEDNSEGGGSREEDLKEVVFVCQADTVEMVVVKTGIQDDTYIRILEGLKEGERVVSGPYSTVTRRLEQGSAYHEKKKDDKQKKTS